jgi:tetraacyldisaccharide 4'-kinase
MKRRLRQIYLRSQEGSGSWNPLLDLLAGLYRFGSRLHHAGYNRGWRRVAWVPRPTLSVGGIVAGGTGKTPAVILLAETLHAMGRVPLILLRGYGAVRTPARPLHLAAGGSPSWREAGDEACLLARRCPGAGVLVHPDRIRSARWALDHIDFDTILLDDGFQHRRMGRDLDFVCLDAAQPLGSGELLPKGDLREAPGGLRRADGLLLTRSAGGEKAPPVCGETPLMRLAWRLDEDLLPAGEGDRRSSAELRGRRLGLMAGIARPRRFLNDIEALGLTVVWTWLLPDHEPLAAADVARIAAAFEREALDGLLITEKDAVRWSEALAGIEGVYIVRGSAQWAGEEDRAVFVKLLRGALNAAGRR